MFYPHYVASLTPLWIFSGSYGVFTLQSRWRREAKNPIKRLTAITLLGLWFVNLSIGSARWIGHYGRRASGAEITPTVPILLAQARAQASLGGSTSDGHPVLPFLAQNPAHSILQATLLRWVDGQEPRFVDPSTGTLCKIELGLPGRPAPPGRPLYYEYSLHCELPPSTMTPER